MRLVNEWPSGAAATFEADADQSDAIEMGHQIAHLIAVALDEGLTLDDAKQVTINHLTKVVNNFSYVGIDY